MTNILLDTWATTMWRACWQGGLIVLVVWSICRSLPSMPARFQCWLWRLAILKFMVALGTRADRAIGKQFIVECRVHEKLRAIAFGADLLDQFRSKAVSKRNIDHHQVRLEFHDSPQRGGDVVRPLLDFRIQFRPQQARQPLSNDRVVVDQQDLGSREGPTDRHACFTGGLSRPRPRSIRGGWFRNIQSGEF